MYGWGPHRTALVCAVVVAIAAAGATPIAAHANAGTPLMWATMLHLFFGNAIIGILEGLLLAVFFRLPKGKTIFLLIAANYASAWLGGLFIIGGLADQISITLANVYVCQ